MKVCIGVSNQQIILIDRYKDLFHSLDNELQNYLKALLIMTKSYMII